MFDAALDLMRAAQAFDLKAYLISRHFDEMPNGEWLRTCPVCGKEGKLSCRLRKRNWKCWVCMRLGPPDEAGRRRALVGGGGVLRLIRWVERCSFREAVAILFAGARERTVAIDQIPEFELVVDVIEEAPEPKPIPPPECAAPIVSELSYMQRRGITMEDVRTYGLFWCCSGRYRNRIVFPCWESGRLIYWQARAMWEASDQKSRRKFVKALNPPRDDDGALVSSDVLFNLELAALHPSVAICEGPIDAIHTGPSAVCTFGKRMTDTQVARLLNAGVKAVDLIWDGPGPTEPEGAWPEMVALAPRLGLFFETKLVRVPYGDPGMYPREQIDAMRCDAVPVGAISRLVRI